MEHVFVWTTKDVVGLLALIVVALFFALAFLPIYIRQKWQRFTCKHNEGVGEDMSCTAWCRKCGKCLGFIGNLPNQGRPDHSASTGTPK